MSSKDALFKVKTETFTTTATGISGPYNASTATVRGHKIGPLVVLELEGPLTGTFGLAGSIPSSTLSLATALPVHWRPSLLATGTGFVGGRAFALGVGTSGSLELNPLFIRADGETIGINNLPAGLAGADCSLAGTGKLHVTYVV